MNNTYVLHCPANAFQCFYILRSNVNYSLITVVHSLLSLSLSHTQTHTDLRVCSTVVVASKQRKRSTGVYSQPRESFQILPREHNSNGGTKSIQLTEHEKSPTESGRERPHVAPTQEFP